MYLHGVAAALIAASSAIGVVHAQVSAPLFVIPVERGADVATAAAADAPWHLALESSNATLLAQKLAGHTLGKGEADRVDVSIGAYVPARSARSDWRAATFVVDFDEAPVAALVAQLRARTPAPKAADVVAFVAGHVRGTYGRGFDIASQVAVAGEGDCTEYAVLTAAVARAVGLPARVALGVALTQEPQGLHAYGHAWAEIDSGSGWQVADAALANLKSPVRYLALGVLEDEGPGYTMSVMQQIQPTWIRRVIVLR